MSQFPNTETPTIQPSLTYTAQPTKTPFPTSTHTPTATLLPAGYSTQAPDGSIMVFVPERTFTMGTDDIQPLIDDTLTYYPPNGPPEEFDKDGDGIDDYQSKSWHRHFYNQFPAHDVFLSSYFIHQTEVTIKQFIDYMNAVGGNYLEGIGNLLDVNDAGFIVSESNGVWKPAIGYDNHPIAAVEWQAAQAYCEYWGGRLPTEAEWENAAKGITYTAYPWGDEFECNFVNINQVRLGCDDGYNRSAPVGSFPQNASSYGTLDMIGNVYEWVYDWYDKDYYSKLASSPTVPENPHGPQIGDEKIIRGGSWMNVKWGNLTSLRIPTISKINTEPDFGFRCVFEGAEIETSMLTENQLFLQSPDIDNAIIHEPTENIGFNWVTYIPNTISFDDEIFIVVHIGGQGECSSEAALEETMNIIWGKFDLAAERGFILLFPSIPRDCSKGENWGYENLDAFSAYGTHLNPQTFIDPDGLNYRLDLQVVEMIKEFSQELEARGLNIADRVFVYGNSASGHFANRFAMLHPEKVKAFAAGGLSGIITLPIDSYQDNPYNWYNGILNFKELVVSFQ